MTEFDDGASRKRLRAAGVWLSLVCEAARIVVVVLLAFETALVVVVVFGGWCVRLSVTLTHTHKPSVKKEKTNGFEGGESRKCHQQPRRPPPIVFDTSSDEECLDMTSLVPGNYTTHRIQNTPAVGVVTILVVFDSACVVVIVFLAF